MASTAVLQACLRLHLFSISHHIAGVLISAPPACLIKGKVRNRNRTPAKLGLHRSVLLSHFSTAPPQSPCSLKSRNGHSAGHLGLSVECSDLARLRRLSDLASGTAKRDSADVSIARSNGVSGAVTATPGQSMNRPPNAAQRCAACLAIQPLLEGPPLPPQAYFSSALNP